MFKIAYCAGHHLGNPKGIPLSMGLGDVREWTLNDRVARYFARAAAKYPQVELLRTDDPSGQRLIDIPDRVAAANDWGADLYLDIHHNGGISGGYGGGVVVFSYPGSAVGRHYRDSIYEAVIAAGGLRGNRAQPRQEEAFDSLRLTHMPAVLAEYGFMDSRTDAPVILTDVYAKLVAEATMAGIAKVAGLQKQEDRQVSLTLPVLENGSQGEPVRSLQLLLSGLGHDCGTADGIFGSKTEAAVSAFRKARGLTPETVVDWQAWAGLLGVQGGPDRE